MTYLKYRGYGFRVSATFLGESERGNPFYGFSITDAQTNREVPNAYGFSIPHEAYQYPKEALAAGIYDCMNAVDVFLDGKTDDITYEGDLIWPSVGVKADTAISGYSFGPEPPFPTPPGPPCPICGAPEGEPCTAPCVPDRDELAALDLAAWEREEMDAAVEELSLVGFERLARGE